MHFEDNSNGVFQENTKLIFARNTTIDGGAIILFTFSGITFKENAVVDFYNNTASLSGGAISSLSNCYM